MLKLAFCIGLWLLGTSEGLLNIPSGLKRGRAHRNSSRRFVFSTTSPISCIATDDCCSKWTELMRYTLTPDRAIGESPEAENARRVFELLDPANVVSTNTYCFTRRHGIVNGRETILPMEVTCEFDCISKLPPVLIENDRSTYTVKKGFEKLSVIRILTDFELRCPIGWSAVEDGLIVPWPWFKKPTRKVAKCTPPIEGAFQNAAEAAFGSNKKQKASAEDAGPSNQRRETNFPLHTSGQRVPGQVAPQPQGRQSDLVVSEIAGLRVMHQPAVYNADVIMASLEATRAEDYRRTFPFLLPSDTTAADKQQ